MSSHAQALEQDARVQRPRLNGIVETALVVEDVAASVAFYRELLGLGVLFQDERLAALDVGPGHTLLLFRRGGTLDSVQLPGGVIPGGQDASGRSHMAFAIDKAELDSWHQWLRTQSVAIESTVTWERGGVSTYFRDPDGNLLELATPGVWANY